MSDRTRFGGGLRQIFVDVAISDRRKNAELGLNRKYEMSDARIGQDMSEKRCAYAVGVQPTIVLKSLMKCA